MALFSSALLSLSVTAGAQPLRILAIGDSITQGGQAGRPEYSYRLPLQRMLGGLGVDFDFVGTRQNGLDSDRWPQPFDPDHEAYYGQTTASVAGHVAANLPRIPAPDVALIHLGTNDAGRWNVWSAITRPAEAIVDELRKRNPGIAILIAEPQMGGFRGALRNVALRILVARLDSQDSPVYFVPSPASWTPDEDTFDGVHPNTRGQMIMAVAWLDAMAPILVRSPEPKMVARSR